jgi:3,4-dihydroxy 2-butanone 4-phosphate synthase / GTP cyclohydrolase II
MKRNEAPVALDRTTLILGRRILESRHGPIEVAFFRDQASGLTSMALACGDLRQRSPLLTRVHSSCLTSECLMACDCDCAEQLDQAWSRIAAAGRGVIFYLMQEGRGAGLTAKARDRMLVQASQHRLTTFDAYAEMGLPSDLRRYDIVGPMAHALGIRGPLDLLTNNPEKANGVAVALADEKVDVRRIEPVEGPRSPFNRDYLRAKRQSGHNLERDAPGLGALPPGPIGVEAPQRSAQHPHLISTARYFLPVSLSANSGAGGLIDWFRMRVVYDLRTARESVVLSPNSPSARNGSGGGEAFTLTLVDRLPCGQSPRRTELRRELLRIRERGQGTVIAHFDDLNPNADLVSGTRDDALFRLSQEILRTNWVPEEDLGGAPDAER